MRIENYEFPKSSFLSVEKDLNIIIDKIMKNDRLKKLLYYPTKDCLNRPNLTQEETLEMFGKEIRIVPIAQIPLQERKIILVHLNDHIVSRIRIIEDRCHVISSLRGFGADQDLIGNISRGISQLLAYPCQRNILAEMIGYI